MVQRASMGNPCEDENQSERGSNRSFAEDIVLKELQGC